MPTTLWINRGRIVGDPDTGHKGVPANGEDQAPQIVRAPIGLKNPDEWKAALDRSLPRRIAGNPVLRNPKDNEVLRPADANASTVKALKQRA